jgi:vacuolar protein sorting-associated protein 35
MFVSFCNFAMLAYLCTIHPNVLAAFILYEEITDSKLQIRSLQLIGTALHSCASIELDNYEALCARCTQLSIKLLRKADQVKLVLLCARLFWRGQIRESSDYKRPKEVLHCLQKALSIADKCMPPQPGLFVDIFDSYVYFFEKHCPTVRRHACICHS